MRTMSGPDALICCKHKSHIIILNGYALIKPRKHIKLGVNVRTSNKLQYPNLNIAQVRDALGFSFH